MWLLVLGYLFGLILSSEAQIRCAGSSTFRQPANSDITVICGTEIMELSILMCPIYFSGYNESLMSLNAMFNVAACHGTPDWSVDPPILKFNFSISEDSLTACSNKIKITQEVGSGQFSDFSSIQFVNVSGMINSLDPSANTITYRQEMMYIFSCRYPLQYLVNNTRLGVSGVSLAVKDNNGSFISTLSMSLFENVDYTRQLKMPDGGVRLKTRIFVEVKATNLTERFNVLLDRCYATTSPVPSNSTHYDLFVGCTKDGQTVMGTNGGAQFARFSFEAFRFVQHKNVTVSTFYLHCATRLCDRSVCNSLQPNCSANKRRKREVNSAQGTSVSDVATVTSGPIITKVDNGERTQPNTASKYNTKTFAIQKAEENGALVGVAITAGVLCVLFVCLIMYIVLRHNSRKK
ncbi:zona pellucida-like domain-containing protein 1 [Conger conger]|uniref:zona pellucida-like domain-containing protein 1 n=1 Tax=Conger conger TaxID=82655 RepID=UPI002A59ECBF|nr:zona pellucida-like domain-containing protein 1 [Conger conger]